MWEYDSDWLLLVIVVFVVFFFFSSRRRHTRCSRDWSSDVCSSRSFAPLPNVPELPADTFAAARGDASRLPLAAPPAQLPTPRRTAAATIVPDASTRHAVRSEERRVGKECRSRGSADR